WKNGDILEIQLPMSLHAEAMPDDPAMIAFLYGPIVLGGDLGKEGLDDTKRYGPNAPQLGRVKPVQVPALVCDLKDVLQRLKPVAGAAMTFKTTGIGRPADVTLQPFYKMADQRYSVYWKVYSAAEWEKRSAEIVAAESRRKEVERRTFDFVTAGDAQSERDHGIQTDDASSARQRNTGNFEGKSWRAARNGWFSYELKVNPDKPMILVCTYRGSEGPRRAFDILVDGEKVGSQVLEINPTSFFDFEYKLPENLTRGKQKVTVKFQSQPEAIAGAVFEVRVIQ
ncbi:MAG TPA: DUF6805 domain-containing protein, partial [Blastocatellia bacterium]|nr:DUF6805 domain-containing protein [Blastocatellia bacterium]